MYLCPWPDACDYKCTNIITAKTLFSVLIFPLGRVAQRDPIGTAFTACHRVNPSTNPREYTAFDADLIASAYILASEAGPDA